MTDVKLDVIHLDDKIVEFNFMLQMKPCNATLIRKLIREIKKHCITYDVLLAVSIASASLGTSSICREVSGESYEHLKWRREISTTGQFRNCISSLDSLALFIC